MLRLFIGVIKQPISLWITDNFMRQRFFSNAFKYDAGIARQMQFGDFFFFFACYHKQS